MKQLIQTSGPTQDKCHFCGVPLKPEDQKGSINIDGTFKPAHASCMTQYQNKVRNQGAKRREKFHG